jgi:outer membrane immunogenic protein
MECDANHSSRSRAAAAIGLAHPAAAADMPMKPIPVKSIFGPTFSWTGFYAGMHAASG